MGRFHERGRDVVPDRAVWSLSRLLRKHGSVQLLILDDWGLEPLDDQACHDLLEFLKDRYGRRSTIITS
ncbi:MAG: hypothetical protein F9K19_09780 [Rhizobiaceae bacterium]|nr:MAG: hypothetical protein F9K19_09780 [Rhizobiaceae bacterium]MDR7032956.1 DNA replication protein DnaC [Mesorhizobium sp. BE184]